MCANFGVLFIHAIKKFASTKRSIRYTTERWPNWWHSWSILNVNHTQESNFTCCKQHPKRLVLIIERIPQAARKWGFPVQSGLIAENTSQSENSDNLSFYGTQSESKIRVIMLDMKLNSKTRRLLINTILWQGQHTVKYNIPTRYQIFLISRYTISLTKTDFRVLTAVYWSGSSTMDYVPLKSKIRDSSLNRNYLLTCWPLSHVKYLVHSVIYIKFLKQLSIWIIWKF